MDEPPQRIELIGEDGREHVFLLHDAFEMEGGIYYLVEASDDPQQVLVLKAAGDRLEALRGKELDRVMAHLDEEDGGEEA
ncbi:MAG TPA: hypothetical protein VMU49_05615 [Candidatus Acidoferrales bacterium]|nr:hypothetical protein [Candidatus Acidoferrales bacterium]